METFKNFLTKEVNEAVTDGLTTYQIKARDQESILLKLLKSIKSLGNIGHSFEIIIDKDSEHEEKFYWDGDGSDSIQEIKIIK